MKRIVFLLLNSVLTLVAWSQSPYLPFVEEGKTWEIEMNMPPSPDTLTFVLKGDTIIGGVMAKRLFCRGRHVHSAKERYECALFEDASKVMCIPPNNTTPTLLYQFTEPGTDFGVHPLVYGGKTYKYSDTTPEGDALLSASFKSLSWSSVENNGIRRIVQKVEMRSEMMFGVQYTEWVEGIGYVYGPSSSFLRYGLTGFYGARVLSVSVGDRVEYNVTSLAPPMATPQGKEVLHGLDGRKLNTPPADGVYLRNGQKVVRQASLFP